MPTQKKDHELILQWKKLRDTYLAEGFSKKKIYEIIARDYETTPNSVKWYLDCKDKSAKYRKRYAGRIEDLSRSYERISKDTTYFFDLIRLFEDAFREQDVVTSDQVLQKLLDSKDVTGYSKTFKRFFSLLPLTEVEKGKYQLLK
jgi:hypothetical protein